MSEEELLRRVQDRLVRVRGLVGELETLARNKASRVDELIATLESDDLRWKPVRERTLRCADGRPTRARRRSFDRTRDRGRL